MATAPATNFASALTAADFRLLADAVDAHTRAGRWADAEAACRAAVAAHPGDGPLLMMLGVALVRAGRFPEAIGALRQAVAVWPTPQAWMSLGTALLEVLRKGDPIDEAVDAFTRASAGRPGYAEADLQLGRLLLDAGRPAEAAAACRRALAAKPDWPRALISLGNALFATADLDGALDQYRRAMAVAPEHPTAVLNVGNVLAARGHYAEAIDAFRRSLALRPGERRAQNNLATALYLAGQLDDAEAIDRQVLAAGGADAGLLMNFAGLLKDKGQLDESIDYARQAMAADPDYLPAQSNLVYTLSFHPDYGPAAVLAEARQFDARHTAALTAAARLRPHANDRSPDRRLRIGYVSPDLRRHAVGQFMVPLVRHHDPPTGRRAAVPAGHPHGRHDRPPPPVGRRVA